MLSIKYKKKLAILLSTLSTMSSVSARNDHKYSYSGHISNVMSKSSLSKNVLIGSIPILAISGIVFNFISKSNSVVEKNSINNGGISTDKNKKNNVKEMSYNTGLILGGSVTIVSTLAVSAIVYKLLSKSNCSPLINTRYISVEDAFDVAKIAKERNNKIRDDVSGSTYRVVYNSKIYDVKVLNCNKDMDFGPEKSIDYKESIMESNRLVVKMEHHNLAKVYAVCDDCIIMESFDGISLREWYENNFRNNFYNGNNVAKIERLILEISDALKYLEKIGYQLLNLNPDNIQVIENHQDIEIKIINFDKVTSVEKFRTIKGKYLFSNDPFFQPLTKNSYIFHGGNDNVHNNKNFFFSDEEINIERFDVYSFGLLIAYLITGKIFRKSNNQTVCATHNLKNSKSKRYTYCEDCSLDNRICDIDNIENEIGKIHLEDGYSLYDFHSIVERCLKYKPSASDINMEIRKICQSPTL